MTYNNRERIPLRKRIYHKFWLSLANFPLNRIRCFALKKCRYNIGTDVYIGKSLIVATILGKEECKLTLKNRVAMGPRVTLLLASDANWSKLNDIISPIRGQITIEEDCWIGANVTIMPNIVIGKYSIIGAGAVVTKDVPPYSVAVGIPAKIIKKLKD